VRVERVAVILQVAQQALIDLVLVLEKAGRVVGVEDLPTP